MNRRYGLIGVVVIVLALNAWQWWPARRAPGADSRAATERWTPDALRVKVAGEAERVPPARRDLFQRRVIVVKAPPPPPPPPVAATPPGPPPKTPEQLAEEAARAELAQIKLVGIVFRGEKGEAFLVKGEQAFIVHSGEKIGERFAVESVSAEAVALKDPTTQVSGKLSVSGK